MHRTMSSRTVCTSDGDPPRYKYLREHGMPKVRRTRKAPDFYSPENASKSCTRSKKLNSDDNDSWKPESETDEVHSESESERSNGKREKSTGRRKSLPRKSPPEEEHAEMEADEEPLAEVPQEEKIESEEGSSESDEEEKSPREKEDAKSKDKKVKGCRELQDLLDGCVQVHKESRTRRLPPRREHSRTLQTNGHSDSTWSHGSSRAVTDKDSGPQQLEDKQNLQNSSKQPSSPNTSSAHNVQKTLDSSTGDPLMVEVSETVDDSKALISTRRSAPYVKNDVAVTCRRKSKTTTVETVSDSSVRVKRQRVDVDTSQTRKMSKETENGAHGTKSAVRDVNKKETPVIKLPRMPMIRNGDYWYRARIKQETRESVFVEFTGFEDGMIKPFWIRKDSADVFKGSYSGKDWKYAGDGAWEPKPRKVISKRQNNRGRRGRKRGGPSKTTDTREASKVSQDYADQGCTGDSEKCSKTPAGVLGERVFYRKAAADGQGSGCLEKTRCAEAVLNTDASRREDKNMDCGSQSDVPAKLPSEESFPNAEGTPQQIGTLGRTETKPEVDQDWPKPNSGSSPFSRNAGTSGSSQQQEAPNKDSKKQQNSEPGRKDNSSSAGVTQSEERMPPRLRRKPGKPVNERQEDERHLPSRHAKTLRRSARLCPKGSWKFRDDSSSEAECDEDGVNTPASRRNSTAARAAMSKYITRSVRNTESGRRNSGGLSTSQSHSRANQIQKPRRSIFPSAKRSRRTVLRREGMKDEIYEEEYDELFDHEDQLEDRSPTSHPEHSLLHKREPKGPSGADHVDGVAICNLGVSVLSQIRKYLPYYTNHIPDARLSAFVELMERLDGVRTRTDTSQKDSSDSKAMTRMVSVSLPERHPEATGKLPPLLNDSRDKLP